MAPYHSQKSYKIQRHSIGTCTCAHRFCVSGQSQATLIEVNDNSIVRSAELLIHNGLSMAFYKDIN